MSTTQITETDRETTAADVIQSTLTRRFDEMCALRRKALKWKDPDGVHSMHMASRRLRSATSDFMPYLKRRDLAPSLKRIRSIADALGEVRDQDVAIMALEELSPKAPKEVAATLEELIDARKEVRREARRELKRLLDKEQLQELRTQFAGAITTATSPPSQGPDKRPKSALSYTDIAKNVVRDHLSEFQKVADSLYRPLEADPTHQMRIATRGLGDAIELLDDCLDSSLAPFAKHANRLQSALGKIHDCDVWIESFGEEIVAAKTIKRKARDETFVWLIGRLIKLRNTNFRKAFSRSTKWESDSFSDELKEALNRDRNGQSKTGIIDQDGQRASQSLESSSV